MNNARRCLSLFLCEQDCGDSGVAGWSEPVRRIIAGLPAPCSASVFVVMHIGNNPSYLPSLLSRPGFAALFAQDGAEIEPSRIHVAPPDHHVTLEPGRIRLN